MSTIVKVPELGESISQAKIIKLLKNSGDFVAMDEVLLELETDKITIEVSAPHEGYLEKILISEGDTVNVNDALIEITTEIKETKQKKLSPSARLVVKQENIDLSDVKKERITKKDLRELINNELSTPKGINKPMQQQQNIPPLSEENKNEFRVPMSSLRIKVAEHLKKAQNEAAILTTFNEVNMDRVYNLRKKYKQEFEEKHGVRFGLMSFFVKASIEALKEFPNINCSVENNEIVYKKYYNIGIAISTAKGLVVPVIKNAEDLSFSDIEKSIQSFAAKAKSNKLVMDDLMNGSFTITNGGVFGSLLSTPILNPPQSAILGMHTMQKRPVVSHDDQIKISYMMYLALSYDHRVIDGQESISFLMKIKNLLETPEKFILDL